MLFKNVFGNSVSLVGILIDYNLYQTSDLF